MPAGTKTEPGRARRWRIMPATLILAAAGLGAMVPASHAAARPAPMAGSSAFRAVSARPVTAYVANESPGTVTPITTATNTAGPAIRVGTGPKVIAITPDGKTAYVAQYLAGTVTPITTATNIPGPPIRVGGSPRAIAITP
jgi:DNA-binding beta-propeller fold protein YncE